MMSPDGKYVWNGHEWVAVASSSDAGHVGVFPSWNTITVEPVEAAAPRPVAVQPAIQYPVQANPLDYRAGGAVTPLWERQPKSGMTNYLYIGPITPENPTIVDYLGEWPWRALWIGLIVTAGMALFTAIWPKNWKRPVSATVPAPPPSLSNP